MKSILFFIASVSAGLVHVPGTTTDNKLEPIQQRLAYAGPNGMTVSWNTYAKLSKPTVHYGTSPFKLDKVATSSESITYQTSNTYNNHVELKGLKPATKYWYTVSNTDCYNCSQIPAYTFTTARPAGDKSAFTMAVTVDMGLMGSKDGLSDTVGNGAASPLGPNDTDTVQSLLLDIDTYEFILHPGDIAYADYWLKEEIQKYIPGYQAMDQAKLFAEGAKVYERLNEEFMDQLTPITSIRPYMVGPGNHDSNCDNFGTKDKANNISYTDAPCYPGQQNFTGYINHWRMPSGPSGGLGNFWWSMDYGLVHFVQFSTETDFGNGQLGPDVIGGDEGSHATRDFGKKNQQIDFLKKDLANVDRSKTPWIIVAGHRPFYGEGGSDTCTQCRDVFEGIFDKYGVDLVLAGHVHNYERLMPLSNNGTIDKKGLNNPSAPWYIVNGAAGHYGKIDSSLA